MSKKKAKNQPRTNYEVYRSIRKDWGNDEPRHQDNSRQTQQETEAQRKV